MKLKAMKSSCLVAATLIFSIFISSAFADARIIRGEINIDDGPKISFSAPVGLLQALKTSGISAVVENKEELCRLIDSLIGELESIKDNHLLVLRAKNEVEAHVWVEEVSRDEPMRANFVFVDVTPSRHEPEVSLRLPQGIFFLGSFIGNQFVEEHRKDILETFKKMVLIKIKEKELRHKQEPPHYKPQPIEEMHQRINNLREKIDYLRREGRHDEAEGLEREIQEIKRKIEEMERGQVQGQPPHEPQPIVEMHRRIGNLKEKIDQLRREGRHGEAEGLEREIQDIKRKIEEMERGQVQRQPQHEPQPIEEMHRRIGDLKEKIDQLRREGRHDEAEGLKREVDDIRRNIEEMERRSGQEQPHQESPYNSEQRTRIINEAVDNMFKAAQRLHEANMHEQAEELVREAEKFRREIQK